VTVKSASGRRGDDVSTNGRDVQASDGETAVEALLRHEVDRKTLLLDVLTHELRSPLTTIAGCADVLRDRHGPTLTEHDRDRLLARITANADRIRSILTNLADISREEAGALQVHRRLTDMAGLVGRVREHLDAAGHLVEVVVDEPFAQVDGFLAERIIENLIANAVRHTPAGAPILVRVSAAPSGLEVTVSDGGPGVAAGLHTELFDRFRQGDGALTRDGAGLGLSVVQRFAEAHDGRAWLEDGPGGAVFHVLLRNRVPET